MTWTQAWPMAENDPVDVAHEQDLVDEFNIRLPIAPPGSPLAPLDDAYEGESTWNFIQRVRQELSRAVGLFSDPDDYGNAYTQAGATGHTPCPSEPPSDALYSCIFNKVFGSGRHCWLKGPTTGTEEASIAADPTEGYRAYTQYFNEFHDIIETLIWQRVEASSSYVLRKIGTKYNAAAAADAIDEAWAAMDAASPTATADGLSRIVAYTASGKYTVSACVVARIAYTFAIPAGALAVKFCCRSYSNYYPDTGGVKQPWPDHDLDIYVGTASPTGVWAYGTLGASIDYPAIALKATGERNMIADLTNWTANATNYLQLRTDAENETKPTFYVAGGHWPASPASATSYKRPNFWRLLWRKVAAS